jgi:hypothetical protein
VLAASVASLGALFTLTPHAGATTYFFDPTGSIGATRAATGTWDNTSNDWTNASGGTLTANLTPWINAGFSSASPTDTAAASFNTGGGTVMIASGATIYVNQIYDGGSNGTLTAGNTSSAIDFDGANPVFTFGNSSVNFNMPIIGISSITFSGSSGFTRATSTYSGATTVTAGAGLSLYGTPAAGWGELANTTSVTIGSNANVTVGDTTAADNTAATDNRINSAASLIFNGDDLTQANSTVSSFVVNTGTSFSQTFSSLALNGGAGDSLTIAAGSALVITGAGGGGYVRPEQARAHRSIFPR